MEQKYNGNLYFMLQRECKTAGRVIENQEREVSTYQKIIKKLSIESKKYCFPILVRH